MYVCKTLKQEEKERKKKTSIEIFWSFFLENFYPLLPINHYSMYNTVLYVRMVCAMTIRQAEKKECMGVYVLYLGG